MSHGLALVVVREGDTPDIFWMVTEGSREALR